MSLSQWRRLAALAGTVLLLTVLLALHRTPPSPQPAPQARVALTILAINDFHGNLRPPLGGISILDPQDRSRRIAVPAGGAEHMATLVKQLRANKKNSVFVAAGDLIGASPLLSALFHDEPTIESLSQMGLEITAVGNHEFDEGKGELLRMQNGGCHPVDGCRGPQHIRRRQVPLPRRQHLRQEHRQDPAPRLRGQGIRWHPCRLHRPHA